MKVVDISKEPNTCQSIYLPLKTIKDYDLSLGVFDQLHLNSDQIVIGRVFLLDIPNADFAKVNKFVSDQRNKVFVEKECIKSVSKLKCAIADSVSLKLICDTVETTLQYRTEVKRSFLNANLMRSLHNTVIKDGFQVNLSESPLRQEYNIQTVIVDRVQDDAQSDEKAFVLLQSTRITELTVETSLRTQLRDRKRQIFLGGLAEQEKSLIKLLDDSNKSSQPKTSLSLRGCLVSGPSGCGKTKLIQKVAESFDYLVCPVQCSELMRPSPGETEKLLRSLFEKAKLHSQEGRTLLLFENVDLIGNKDGNDDKLTHNLRAVSQLRSLMDNAGPNLIIAATTCHPTDVHSSLRRPGRLTNEIFIQVPNLKERQEILAAQVESRDLSDSIGDDQILDIAKATQGYVGSDLESLMTNMTMRSAQDLESFEDRFKKALRLTSPSGFKSGIGSVQLNPISWDKIGGLEDVKKELQAAIMWPLQHPELFEQLDVRRTKGVLVYGPPGCGKTTLVRAMASMSGATFLSVSAASIFSPYVGDSEKALAQVFHKARLGAPSVLFIDEIDAMVTNRGQDKSGSGVQDRVLSVLLNEMDGIGSNSQSAARSKDSLDNDVIVVGATNRPDMLDPALCRPGRLDKIIYVPEPDTQSRLEILKVATCKIPLDKDVDLNALAEKTSGFSGADVENLCKEAALSAMTSRIFGSQPSDLDSTAVTMDDFTAVFPSFRPSLTPDLREQYANMKASIAK